MKRQIMAAGLVVMTGAALVACKDQKKPQTADARAAGAETVVLLQRTSASLQDCS